MSISVQDVASSGFVAADGTTGEDYATAVALDSADNSFVVGTLDATSRGPEAPPRVDRLGQSNFFIASGTPDGQLRWGYEIGGDGEDNATGVAVGLNGHVYVSGNFQGRVDFDPQKSSDGRGVREATDVGQGGFDFYVLELTGDGEFVDVTTFGHEHGVWDYATDIAVDSSGGVLVTGWFGGRLDIDPGPQTEQILSSRGNQDIFLLRLTSTGELDWARSIGGDRTQGFTDYGTDVEVDGDGNVFLAGRAFDTVDFDPLTTQADGGDTINASADGSAFVVSYGQNGDFRWVRQVGEGQDELDDTGNGTVRGLTVTPQGTVAAVGEFRNSGNGSDVFITEYAVSDGAEVWSSTLGANGDDRGRGVTSDADGNLYVTGFYNLTVDFDAANGDGTFERTARDAGSTGAGDGFLVKFNSQRKVEAVNTFGSDLGDDVAAVAVDSTGRTHLAGYLQDTATFEANGDSVDVTSNGLRDAFLFVVPPSENVTPPTEVIDVRVEAVGLDGERLDEIELGQQFYINIYAQDLRATPAGVTALYADVQFDTSLIDVTGIEHAFDGFLDGQIDDAAGLVDEAGGTLFSEPDGVGEQLVFSLIATATELGALTISTDAGEDDLSENTLLGIAEDVRTRTRYGTLTVQIVGQPELVVTAFDAVDDFLTGGRTRVEFTVVNQGNGPADEFEVDIVHSDDDRIGDADDLLVTTITVRGLAAGESRQVSVDVQLDLAVLRDRAFRDNPAGLGENFVSTSRDLLGLAIDPDNLIQEQSEAHGENGLRIDRDDVTYFSFDVNGDGRVRPTDVNSIINDLRSAPGTNSATDLNGDGRVNLLDTNILQNRRGYRRNELVNEAAIGINPPADVSFDRITGAPLALESQLNGPAEVETDSTPPADETANVASLAFPSNATETSSVRTDVESSTLVVLPSSTGPVATSSPDTPDATNGASSPMDETSQTPDSQIADDLFSTNDWIDAI